MSFITLADAKKQLNKLTTADDAELNGFIAAACGIVEDLKGHVEPQTFTSARRAAWVRESRGAGCGWRSRWIVDLPETPLLQVLAVSRVGAAGAVNVIVDGDLLVMPGRGDYTISYVAGRAEVPSEFRMAALELVTHLWRGSQLNQSGGRPGVRGGDGGQSAAAALASALPYRVRELLGIYGQVVSDHVVIA